jgi:diketogulonate reductase-like aldo/keto reductase
METLKYKNGDTVPAIGFGTSHAGDEDDVVRVVSDALQAGYRLIDSAKMYGNEADVGKAVRESSVPREEIFVTTKLWKADLGYESAFTAYDRSLKELGLDYADLYLIHWPTNDSSRNESWRALVEMQADGRIPHIGVSNFTVDHLEELKTVSEVIPEVNQIELHPYVWEGQRPIVEYCQKNGIMVQAYSPLLRGGALNDETVGSIAGLHHKTPAQILLRWVIQHGAMPLPKTTKQERMKQNIDVFDFELSDEHMQVLDSLTNGERFAPDPHEIA